MKLKTLKTRFVLATFGIYLFVVTVAAVFFFLAIDRIVEGLGTNFAVKQALWNKNRILAPIQRELALARQLAGSPLLKEWSRNESDPVLARLALAELESYRASFQDKSFFFVVDHSRHYYFNDATGRYRGRELKHTLSELNDFDDWYFSTMAAVADFDLNVDYDPVVNATKVWINVVVRDGGEKLGLGGTGLDLGEFIAEVTARRDEGVSTILLDRGGAIQAHENTAYIEHNTVTKGEAARNTIYRLMDIPAEQKALRALLEKLAGGASEVETLHLTVEGRPYLVAATYLKDIDWYNLVLVDLSQVLSNWRFAPMAGLLLFALLALMVLITVMLDRSILTPLARLTRSSREIAAGRYDTLPPVERNDEIGHLTQAFNRMAETVRNHTAGLEQAVKRRTEELSVSHARLAESNRRLMDSIHYAELIQSSILPKKETLDAHLREHFVLWKPRDIVGGDFYFFREHEGSFLVAVIDCTGHGVPGAFMTMTAYAVINRVIDEICADDPAAILQAVGRIMRTMLQQDGAAPELDNGLDMGLCLCEPAQGRLTFAGARIPLVYTQGGELFEIKGDAQSLGYRRSKSDFAFTNHTLALRPDMAFYLTTDGFLDQAGGRKGFGFGKRRFKEIIASHGSLPMERQQAAFAQSLADYQAERGQRDDITLIGFRLPDERETATTITIQGEEHGKA